MPCIYVDQLRVVNSAQLIPTLNAIHHRIQMPLVFSGCCRWKLVCLRRISDKVCASRASISKQEYTNAQREQRPSGNHLHLSNLVSLVSRDARGGRAGAFG